MFKEVFIPAPAIILVALAIMTSIFYGVKLIKYKNKEVGKTPKHILTIANSLMLAMVLATIAHDHWQWEKMLSNTTMMKLVLILVGGLAIYANVMYIRAELVYKEKRGISVSKTTQTRA